MQVRLIVHYQIACRCECEREWLFASICIYIGFTNNGWIVHDSTKYITNVTQNRYTHFLSYYSLKLNSINDVWRVWKLGLIIRKNVKGRSVDHKILLLGHIFRGLRNDPRYQQIKHNSPSQSFLLWQPKRYLCPALHSYVNVLHFFQASATWENTWMLIWGSGDVLCGIPSCTLFRGVQLKSYFKHPVTTLCGSVCTCTPLYVELFICLQHFPAHFIGRNTRGQAKGRKKRLLSKLGFGWGRER